MVGFRWESNLRTRNILFFRISQSYISTFLHTLTTFLLVLCLGGLKYSNIMNKSEMRQVIRASDCTTNNLIAHNCRGELLCNIPSDRRR